MPQGFGSEIEQLSQHKGIKAEIVLDAVKDAMLAAARKYYKTEEDLVAEVNAKTGGIAVYAVKTVTNLVANSSKEMSLAQARRIDPKVRVGGEIRIEKPTEPLGRISAQMAKQVISQKVREAERETICAEFENRLNTMEYCTIKRHEGQDVIVELGRTEARMPRREQSRLESYMPGDRVRVVIKSLEKSGRGPAVTASRASEELVKRLFEQEVPEIYDNTVEIKACAREAGERTKIAVQSHDRDVDAVGACVGMKGMRVQTIIRELRGEKIDIIEYYPDPVEMVQWALSPAKVTRVNIVDPEVRHMEVIVDETQLSLAIGKKGQNVRLAAKLIGWRIDIKSEDEKREEVEKAMAAISGGGTPVSLLLEYGLSEGLIDRLIESGTATLEALADMTPEQLLEIPGVGPELIERIQQAATQCYAHIQRTVGGPASRMEVAAEAGTAEGSPEQSPEEAAAPPVLPGVPESGIPDEDDDEELDFDVAELESFGKMNRYREPSQEAEVPLAGAGASETVADGTPESSGAESADRGDAPEASGNEGEEKNDSH